MAKKRFRDWTTGTALVVGATVLFYAGLVVGRPMLSAVTLRMPENYQYLARRHAEAGRYELALQACDRELARTTYNFQASHLKAEILRAAGRREEALALLGRLPRLYYSLRGRTDVSSRGWDEARMRYLVAEVLWELGRYEEALDNLQAALDWHDPDVDRLCGEFVERVSAGPKGEQVAWAYVARAVLDPKTRLDRVTAQELSGGAKPPANCFGRLMQLAIKRRQLYTARPLALQEFETHSGFLPSLVTYHQFTRQFPAPRTWRGATVPPRLSSRIERATIGRVMFKNHRDQVYHARGSWLALRRGTFVEGSLHVWQKSNGICIVAKGEVCNEVWPVLVIRHNGRVVGRRYIHLPCFAVYTLPMQVPPGRGTIEIGLENDEYNPITGQDRNLVIEEIRFY